jgi:hypothetical protein
VSFSNSNRDLFFQGDLDGLLQKLSSEIQPRVDEIARDQFLVSSEEDLCQYIRGHVAIDPITLFEDPMQMEEEEVEVDVSQDPMRNPRRDRGPLYVYGIRVTVTIPFTGNGRLWNLRLGPFQSTFPKGRIRMADSDGIGYLDVIIERPTDEGPETIRKLLESNLERIRSNLSKQKLKVDEHNASLDARIRQAVRLRRDRITRHEGIAAALNIPLRRKVGAPDIRNLPIRRKLIRPLPAAPKSGFKAETGISPEDYEHILSVIRHEGRTFETTPETYSVHEEEGLRNILLAHLNGHYEGDATGETFRRTGKTDIRIEDNQRAAFVAECKIWRGEAELMDAVDQLLGYLTWRDCKAALVVFNKRNAKFVDLLTKVPSTIGGHRLLKKDLGQQRDGEWRYLLVSDEDEAREICVHVFLFNLYVRTAPEG